MVVLLEVMKPLGGKASWEVLRVLGAYAPKETLEP
jgi:hypothetical protein